MTDGVGASLDRILLRSELMARISALPDGTQIVVVTRSANGRSVILTDGTLSAAQINWLLDCAKAWLLRLGG